MHKFSYVPMTRKSRNRPFQEKLYDDGRVCSRPLNDTPSYFHRLDESTAPLYYNINPNYNSYCRDNVGHDYDVTTASMFPRDVKRTSKMASIENMNSLKMLDASSRMQERTRKGYGNITNSVMAVSNCMSCDGCNKGVPCDCEHCKGGSCYSDDNACRPGVTSKNSLDTRNFDGCSDLNGIFINRFDFLCQNPQDLDRVVFYDNNRRLGEETRLDMRDNYPDGVQGISNASIGASGFKRPEDNTCWQLSA